MSEIERPVDDVLAHSEDEGEWEDEPTRIESRPSGSQVISARLPSDLAEGLLTAAASRGIRPSELVREAVEAWLRPAAGSAVDIRAYAGNNMRLVMPSWPQGRTENYNLVVGVETTPERVEVLPSVA
jgi:hypothetical protein